MIRREFLKTSTFASGVALFPGFLNGFNQFPLSADGKKLIVIQLSGGNDGLNTCVPFRNDIYYQQRPSLAIAKENTFALNDEIGLHPSLKQFKELYDQGSLMIVNQVGYPNAERSHFRAMDIWHTASNADEYWKTGWLGRYLDHNCQGGSKPHQVVEIDDTLSLAVKGTNTKALAVKDPRKLYKNVHEEWVQELYQGSQEHPPVALSGELSFLYKTLAETVESADYIYQKSRIYSHAKAYPGTPIGNQLKIAGELILSGVDTTVYYVSHTGFDTHVRQSQKHEQLLNQLDDAVGAFSQHMKQNGKWEDIMVMIFSEFGRRVSQNASIGTDHGKANTVFVLGGGIKHPGIYNDMPNLTNLDEGDIPFEVDFRCIYATILNRWLGADDEKILQRKFNLLNFLS